MANAKQVVGRAKVKIDGQSIDTAGDTTLDPGGVSREPVAGDYEAGAFRQGAPRPAKLDISILAKGGFSAVAFGAIDNATVSVDFDNGRSFILRGAYAEAAPTITTSDGKAKGVLYAEPAEEVR